MKLQTGLITRTRQSTLLSGAVAGLLLRFFTVAATPVGIALAARSLSTGDFGRYAGLLAAGTTTGLLCTFQLRELIARADDDELDRTWAVGGATLLTLFLGLAGVTGAAVAFGLGSTQMLAFGLLVLAQPIESMAAGQLVRAASAVRLGVIQVLIPLFRLLGAVGLFLTARPTVAQFLSVVALAQIGPSIVGIGRNGIRRLMATGENISRSGPMFRAGATLTMTMSGSIIIQRSDVAMLDWLSDRDNAGDYLAVLQVVDVPWMLAGAAFTLLLPALRERDHTDREQLVVRLLFGLLILITPAAIVTALFTPFVTELLLDRAADVGISTIAFASAATILSSVVILLGQYAVVAREDRRFALVSVAASVGNLLLNLVLIRDLSALGAAVATFTSYGFMVIGLSVIVFDGDRRPVWRTLILPTVATAAAAGGLAYLGLRLIVDGSA